MSATDVYLCGNDPYGAPDVVLRTVAPCTAVATDDAGSSHSSGGVLGRRPPRPRPAKKPARKPYVLPVVFDIEPEDLVVATFGLNDLRALREMRDIDALIACDAI